ncbi:hypothetical protein AVEN_222942-1, partial [Araneus ventricosus]
SFLEGSSPVNICYENDLGAVVRMSLSSHIKCPTVYVILKIEKRSVNKI